VGDAVIRRFNKRYLRHPWATDVLAFPSGGGSRPGRAAGNLLGDVMISAETARRQARKRGHSLETELKILTLHGLLNLLKT